MRILITGGSGFIGSHLTTDLLSTGHDAMPVDRDFADLRLEHDCKRTMDFCKPEVVVHLAAKVGRLFGEDNPPETIEDNVTMTAQVAKATAAVGARIVYASTSEIYGDNGETLCDEITGTFTQPYNLYGLTKKWGEQMCRHYCPDGLTILRPSMPYGPGLPPGRGRAAIVNMLHQADTQQPIPVHRGAERSWCWIGDTVAAIRMIIENTEGGIFNVGRDDAKLPMVDVARIACELTGADDELIQIIDPPERQTVVKRLSTQRLKELGWQPTVDIYEGMQLTLDWVRRLESTAAQV